MERVVIVGAGTFGASLAWWLRRRGDDVVLVDQFEPGDARATSGGETRLIRCSHGPQAGYARLARRARELWRELEAETGEALLEECGVSWFARREDGWEAAAETVLRELGIPVERVEAAAFPSWRGDDLAFVLHEPEAGVLRAARAVRALVRAAGVPRVPAGDQWVRARARPAGAQWVRARARPAAGGAVGLDDGSVLEGDRVVWACGAWMCDLFPELVQLRVTCQELFFFAGGPAWAGTPAWVDFDGAFYGTGDVDGLGVKVAWDAEGPPLDPDAELPAASAEGERRAREYLAHRFPALASAPLVGAKTCRYEISIDSHFIAAPHPSHPNVWLVGGGSGHGFKHGPALAERLAAVWEGREPLPREFGLGDRPPGGSLRTAGTL